MNELMYIVCKSGYSVMVTDRERKDLTYAQIEVLKKNWGKVKYNGNLSAAASRKLAHILEIWFRAIKISQDKKNLLTANEGKKLVFITLTLSDKQMHTDNEIKRNMLNTFLITLGRSHGMVNYLWKAEKQKNGNIHFHIVTDIFIDKHQLNFLWDSIQYKQGYLKKQPIFSNEYVSPSTRIEAIHNNGEISQYMSKYMSKSDENGKVEGRVWGASKVVKSLEDIHFAYDSETEKIVNAYAERKPEKVNVGDFFVTFGTDFFFDIYQLCPHWRSCIKIHYAHIYLCLYGETNVFNERDFV